MNAVERVKSICKERKIAVSKLESDLGYGNGYINSLKKGKFPHDRLVEIARYLSMAVDELTGNDEDTLPSDAPDENYVILSRNAKKLSPEDRKQLLEIARIMFKEEFKD